MSESRRFPKQTLISFRFIVVVDGLSLWKENRNGLPRSHLRNGWKKKRKYASQSRGGCRRSESGEGLIRLGVIYLKVVDVSLVAIQCQDCLREQHKRLLQLMKS